MKKADRFKKRGSYFFFIRRWGGGLTPNPPPVRTPLTLTETLRPLRHFADLSYHDITSAQSH